MANYTKLTDFASKDDLVSGNPSKVVKGTEIDTEFDAIQTAVATKADTTAIAAMLETTDIGVLVQPYSAAILQTTDIGTLVQPFNAAALDTTDIGVLVQAYDADIATISASQAEMEAGTEAALRSMSPLRVSQAVSALATKSQITATAYTTGSGTFTIPAGVTKLKVTVTGGGGAGGDNNSANYGGGGGGAGGTAIKYLSGLTPGNTLSYSVGAAGTASDGATGGNGGDSTVSSGTQTITTITGGGGVGGYGGGTGPYVVGGLGGTATNGDLNLSGNCGGDAGDTDIAGHGGGSIWGGAGRGANSVGAAVYATAGVSGGGGGGGTDAATTPAGNGGSGVIVFEWAV